MPQPVPNFSAEHEANHYSRLNLPQKLKPPENSCPQSGVTSEWKINPYQHSNGTQEIRRKQQIFRSELGFASEYNNPYQLNTTQKFQQISRPGPSSVRRAQQISRPEPGFHSEQGIIPYHLNATQKIHPEQIFGPGPGPFYQQEYNPRLHPTHQISRPGPHYAPPLALPPGNEVNPYFHLNATIAMQEIRTQQISHPGPNYALQHASNPNLHSNATQAIRIQQIYDPGPGFSQKTNPYHLNATQEIRTHQMSRPGMFYASQQVINPAYTHFNGLIRTQQIFHQQPCFPPEQGNNPYHLNATQEVRRVHQMPHPGPHHAPERAMRHASEQAMYPHLHPNATRQIYGPGPGCPPKLPYMHMKGIQDITNSQPISRSVPGFPAEREINPYQPLNALKEMGQPQNQLSWSGPNYYPQWNATQEMGKSQQISRPAPGFPCGQEMNPHLRSNTIQGIGEPQKISYPVPSFQEQEHNPYLHLNATREIKRTQQISHPPVNFAPVQGINPHLHLNATHEIRMTQQICRPGPTFPTEQEINPYVNAMQEIMRTQQISHPVPGFLSEQNPHMRLNTTQEIRSTQQISRPPPAFHSQQEMNPYLHLNTTHEIRRTQNICGPAPSFLSGQEMNPRLRLTTTQGTRKSRTRKTKPYLCSNAMQENEQRTSGRVPANTLVNIKSSLHCHENPRVVQAQPEHEINPYLRSQNNTDCHNHISNENSRLPDLKQTSEASHFQDQYDSGVINNCIMASNAVPDNEESRLSPVLKFDRSRIPRAGSSKGTTFDRSNNASSRELPILLRSEKQKIHSVCAEKKEVAEVIDLTNSSCIAENVGPYILKKLVNGEALSSNKIMENNKVPICGPAMIPPQPKVSSMAEKESPKNGVNTKDIVPSKQASWPVVRDENGTEVSGTLSEPKEVVPVGQLGQFFSNVQFVKVQNSGTTVAPAIFENVELKQIPEYEKDMNFCPSYILPELPKLVEIKNRRDAATQTEPYEGFGAAVDFIGSRVLNVCVNAGGVEYIAQDCALFFSPKGQVGEQIEVSIKHHYFLCSYLPLLNVLSNCVEDFYRRYRPDSEQNSFKKLRVPFTIGQESELMNRHTNPSSTTKDESNDQLIVLEHNAEKQRINLSKCKSSQMTSELRLVDINQLKENFVKTRSPRITRKPNSQTDKDLLSVGTTQPNPNQPKQQKRALDGESPIRKIRVVDKSLLYNTKEKAKEKKVNGFGNVNDGSSSSKAEKSAIVTNQLQNPVKITATPENSEPTSTFGNQCTYCSLLIPDSMFANHLEICAKKTGAVKENNSGSISSTNITFTSTNEYRQVLDKNSGKLLIYPIMKRIDNVGNGNSKKVIPILKCDCKNPNHVYTVNNSRTLFCSKCYVPSYS